MVTEVVLIAAALAAAIAGLVTSPWVRAICWDSLIHPRHRCHWEKDHNGVRELKAAVDHIEES
jgi:hypothetical protein